jgi:hypothetical protein
MEENIFMRGEPLNLTRQYYIVGKKNGNYYYFSYPYSDVSISSSMISTGYSTLVSSNIKPILVNITKTSSPNFYSFKGGSYNYPLISTNNVIDLKSSGSASIFELFCISGFDGNASNLYPGVWYSLENEGRQPYWNSEFCTESNKGFCNNNLITTNDNTSLNIMFIPYNNTTDESTSLKNWSFLNGKYQCAGDSRNDTGLYWFENFIKNTGNTKTSGCDTGSYTNSNSNNCYFSESSTCLDGFLYKLCNETNECGNCLGVCEIVDENMKPCKYDFSENVKNPLSCNAKKENDNDVTLSTIIILIVCILILLGIIFFCVFIFYRIYKNKNDTNN